MLKTIISLICLTTLSGCFPAVLAGGVIAGTSIAEDRSFGDRIDDNIIKIKITDKFGQQNFKEMFARVSVTVHEGRVLLTGTIKNQNLSNECQKIVWSINGVKEVINELEISSRTIGSVANDTLIANSIRSKILLNKDIKSMNYKIDVNSRIAYIIGIARNSGELEKVVDIARYTKGVSKVVNHAIMFDDNRRNNNF